MSLALNGTNGVTYNDGTLQSSAPGGKNKIIGGDFTINPWQRGTSFAAIGSNVYFADRWHTAYNTTGVITASKATDAPTATQAGIFTQHCISLNVTTADTAIAAGDVCILRHYVEGLNTASFGFGQAGSRNVTLSFWVKGTKTGIHCVSIINNAADRSYVAEYTIVTTNTWEYKTITIPVDTTGTWLYNSGRGVGLAFTLMSGTTYHTTANTWAVGNFFATANQVNALDAISNDFKIALVQLEAGSVATSFDVRSFGQELALCQRYFQIVGMGGAGRTWNTTNFQPTIGLRVEMRAVPTAIVINDTNNITYPGIAAYTTTSLASYGATTIGVNLNLVSSGLTSGATMITSGRVASLSSEL